MPITQVGTTSSVTVASGSSSLSLTWPAGIRAGDVAEVFHAPLSTTAPSGPPTGFTAGSNTLSGSSSPAMRSHYKVCTGSETGTLSVPNAGTAAAKAWLRVWRGIDPTSPILHSVTARSSSGVSSLTANLNTGAITDCLLSYGITLNSGTGTYTPPTSFTEDFEQMTSPGTSGGFRIWTGSGAIAVTPTKSSTAARGAMVAIAYLPLQFSGWGMPI